MHNYFAFFSVYFAVLLVFSSIQTFGFAMANECLRGDWMPLLNIPQRQIQSIDALCRICSPIAVGLLLQYCGINPGFIITSVWYVVSTALGTVIMYCMARNETDDKVYYESESESEESEEDENAHLLKRGSRNCLDLVCFILERPFHSVIQGFKLFIREKMFLLLLSKMLLYLTVLVPYGVLITCYLRHDVFDNYLDVSLFRSIGGFFIVIPLVFFHLLQRRFGVLFLTKCCLLIQCLFANLAVVIFSIREYLFDDATDKGHHASMIASNYLFMIFVWSSSLGCYGFYYGFKKIVKMGISEQITKEKLKVVEISSNKLSVIVVHCVGLFLSSPSSFIYLLFVSFVSTHLGLFIFFLWSRKKSNVNYLLLRELLSYNHHYNHNHVDAESSSVSIQQQTESTNLRRGLLSVVYSFRDILYVDEIQPTKHRSATV